jgi:hypothetical protein
MALFRRPQTLRQPQPTKSALVERAIAEGRAFRVGVSSEAASSNSPDSGFQCSFGHQEVVACLPEEGAGQKLLDAMKRLGEECLKASGVQSAQIRADLRGFDSEAGIPLVSLVVRGHLRENERLVAACAQWVRRAPEALDLAFVPLGDEAEKLTREDIQQRRDAVALAVKESREMSAELALSGSGLLARRGAANGAAEAETKSHAPAPGSSAIRL